MERLGDLHNFGRFVFRADDGLLYKPRTCLWEEAYLSPRGAIRLLIEPFFRSIGSINPFDVAPSLNFRPEFGSELFSGCYVEELPALCPVEPDSVGVEEHALVGGVIALLTWLGITDLHIRNMAFGMANGCFIYAPLDVECIFSDLRLPSQTLLLPSSLIAEERCGLAPYLDVYRQQPSLSATAAVVEGFCSAITTLEANVHEIHAGLQVIPDFSRTPVRVIVRATSAYIDFLEKGVAPTPDLSASEREQLERGDVPYFVRFASSEAINYATSETEWRETQAPRGSGDKQEFLLFNGTAAVPRRYSSTLLAEGALQIARLLDPGELGDGAHEQTKVTFDGDALSIRRGDLRVFTRRRST